MKSPLRKRDCGTKGFLLIPVNGHNKGTKTIKTQKATNTLVLANISM